MALLIVSFIAGVLTVLAPCILPLLPVVLGMSASGRSRTTPYVIVGTLALSIILFTYLLKVSTVFISIPAVFWTYLSGGIITLFGLVFLFPRLWEGIPGMPALSIRSNALLGKGYQRKTVWGDVLVGIALGPIFTSCSPTYFVILASVLPASLALGTLYLFAYVMGLALVLLLIGFLGQRFADRLGALSDPKSTLRRTVGVLFILVGVFIVSGYEKKFEVALLESGFFDITKVEQFLLRSVDDEESVRGIPYKEIVNPSGFVNVESITLGELVGKKVILVDFMTYSCINCQRTFPYLVAWYEKYKSEGLEIVGIHTPEFAFERDIDNVRTAMREFGITYPVVLDNDYATWRSYENNFWPRKYLIDIHGNIVYDHIGEGAYEETEMKIRELLRERAEFLGETTEITGTLASDEVPETEILSRSPETYFGALRNEFLANGTRGVPGTQTLSLPGVFLPNALYLGGTWNIEDEYAESASNASLVYRYSAKDVYIVADADADAEIEILQDGEPIDNAGGSDVDEDGIVRIKESRLYKLVRNNVSEEHTLEIKVKSGTVRLYAFTFG